MNPKNNKLNNDEYSLNKQLGKNEDVEFSEELADEADRVAAKRAAQADARAQQNQ